MILHIKTKILTGIMVIVLYFGVCLSSCKQVYTEDEVRLLHFRVRPQLDALIECVRGLDSVSNRHTTLKFSLICEDGISNCWITFDKDSSFIDKKESIILHFQENKLQNTNADSQFSKNAGVIFKKISGTLEEIPIERLSIYGNDNILIYLNDDQGLFYPLNHKENYKHQLGCSSKTLRGMVRNQTTGKKPFIFSLGDGWYSICGIFCHGIN